VVQGVGPEFKLQYHKKKRGPLQDCHQQQQHHLRSQYEKNIFVNLRQTNITNIEQLNLIGYFRHIRSYKNQALVAHACNPSSLGG
jgi:hypothetical protein